MEEADGMKTLFNPSYCSWYDWADINQVSSMCSREQKPGRVEIVPQNFGRLWRKAANHPEKRVQGLA